MPPVPARQLMKSVSRSTVVSDGATVRQGNTRSVMATRRGYSTKNAKNPRSDDESTVLQTNVANPAPRKQSSARSFGSAGASSNTSGSYVDKINHVGQNLGNVRSLNDLHPGVEVKNSLGNSTGSITDVWNSDVFQSLEEADQLEAEAKIQEALKRYIDPPLQTKRPHARRKYERPRVRLSDRICANVFVSVTLVVMTASVVGVTYLYGFDGWAFDEIIHMESSTKRYQKQLHTRKGGGGTAPQLPSQYERNLRDIAMIAQQPPQQSSDAISSSSEAILSTSDKHYHEVPLQWHIPESGDRTFNEIFAVCLRWSQASDFSEDLFHGVSSSVGSKNNVEQKLHIVPSYAGPSFLNVDSHMVQGLVQAYNLDTVLDYNSQIISSPILMESAELFRNHNGLYKGRLFAMFSNPVERLLSYYQSCHESANNNNAHGHQHDHLRCDSELMGLSLEEYANWRRDRYEFNWLTKTLIGRFGHSEHQNHQHHHHQSTQDTSTAGTSSNSPYPNIDTTPTEELTEDDLELAKYILERKCLVLLSEQPRESWERLETYMGWSIGHPKDKCVASMIDEMVTAANQYQHLDENDPIYEKIARRNSWDMRLYEHVLQLWEEQAPYLYQSN